MTQQAQLPAAARRAGRRRIAPESWWFTLLLGAMGSLPPFSIDTALPALLDIAEQLHGSAAQAALTLSTFMAGFALAQLIFGPFSDRYGRRPTLLLGCGLFTLASLACALSSHIETLLLARFVEGCGAGAGMAMVFAIVRDHFEGHAARAKLSFVTMVINLAPMIAPSVGVMILLVGDWRAIYAALALGGALLSLWIAAGLGESLAVPNLQALQWRRLLGAYAQVLRHPLAFPYMLLNGLAFGCMFGYVSASAVVMMQTFGLSKTVYSLAFAGTALCILLGSFINGRLSHRGVSHALPLATGLMLAVACASALLLLQWLGAEEFWLSYPLLAGSLLGFGLIAPNAAHGAMQPMPHIAGVAGASLGFAQMACGAASAALVAVLAPNGALLSMAATMGVFSSAALLLYLLRIRPAETAANAAGACEAAG